MESIKVFKIFIASPSDVVDERQLVNNVIDEENNNHFDNQGYRLEAVRWENHGSPGIGLPHPQGRNNRLIDECALFIGILWCRFGSPTGVADSGTEEEFDYALAQIGIPDAPLHDIKMYFCDYELRPSLLDIEQLGKVKTFRKRVLSQNIQDWTIKFRNEFKEEFRKHLGKWFYEYIGAGGRKRMQPVSKPLKETLIGEKNPTKAEFRSFNRGF